MTDDLWEAVEKKLEPLCRDGIELSSKIVDKMPKGSSKIGGNPDLPDDVEWPRWKTHPLAFVAQIDLEKIAKLDIEKLLPEEGGLLSFFILDLRYAAVKGAPLDHAIVVHVPTGKKLGPRAKPAGIAPELDLAEAKLSFKKCTTWPMNESNIDLGLTKAESAYWSQQSIEPPEDLMLGHPRGVEYPIGRSPKARLLFQSSRRWNIGGRNGHLYIFGEEEATRARRWDEIQMKQW